MVKWGVFIVNSPTTGITPNGLELKAVRREPSGDYTYENRLLRNYWLLGNYVGKASGATIRLHAVGP